MFDIDLNGTDNKAFKYWKLFTDFYHTQVLKYEDLKFTLETKDFSNRDFKCWEQRLPYHCVYILQNNNRVYVGETNDLTRRSAEHSGNALKNKLKEYRFQKIHIITGFLAENAPARLYEHMLIELFQIDSLFHVVNQSEGQKKIEFLRKNIFEFLFDELCPLLEKAGLIKHKHFRSIANTNACKYSPGADLTKDQLKALNSIVLRIDSEDKRPILVDGDAGTGKTIVATALYYYLKEHERYKDKKIALVYATTCMRSEAQHILKQNGLDQKDVISPIGVTKEHYDIVICDEAHKLRRCKNQGFYTAKHNEVNKKLGLDKTCDELDWILLQTGRQILFYDEKQCTAPADISVECVVQKWFHDTSDICRVYLREQMRVKAGKEYVPYIYNVLYQKTDDVIPFENYEFRLFSSFSDMAQQIDEKERTAGLSRLCTGYAWKWKNEDGEPYIEIDGVRIKWNSKLGGWLRNEKVKGEMGSSYTLAGLDLNYAGVIIGPDLFYDVSDRQIKISRKRFYDKKVKTGVMDEALKSYILNTYAVLLTRGICGTYVYVCDEALRTYLAKYIPVV